MPNQTMKRTQHQESVFPGSPLNEAAHAPGFTRRLAVADLVNVARALVARLVVHRG